MTTETTTEDTIAAELIESMGLPGDRRGEVIDAVRSHCEGTYEDASRSACERDDTGDLAARRERLDRAVWAALDMGAYPAAAARDARIEQAARALERAHLAVADAASEWETDPDGPGARTALCAAVRRWRAAGEAFARAVRS